MASKLIRDITDDEVKEFEETGVVYLKGMFDQYWIERVRKAIDAVIADPGPIRIEPENGKVVIETYAWWRDADFRAYVFDSPAAAVAARLLRSAKVNLLYDQMIVKEPATPKETSWHQDGTAWPIHGEQALTLWMPLDVVDQASGGMRYAVGSHKGKHYAASANLAKNVRPDAKNMSGEKCPDFDAPEYRDTKVSYWDVEPGDVLAHFAWTAHFANGNNSPDRRRRAYTTRWCGDKVTFQEGYFQLRTPFAVDLKDGAPLDSAYFPNVPLGA